jgi:hypothetical protein
MKRAALPGDGEGLSGQKEKTMDEKRYQNMLAADAAGHHDRAGEIARLLAAEERRNDAAARNRALLGPRTAAERNAALVGRPRGPRGEAS